jgi:hypothetical protein
MPCKVYGRHRTGKPRKLSLVLSPIDKEFYEVYLIVQTAGRPLLSKSDPYRTGLRNSGFPESRFSEIHLQLGFEKWCKKDYAEAISKTPVTPECPYRGSRKRHLDSPPDPPD